MDADLKGRPASRGIVVLAVTLLVGCGAATTTSSSTAAHAATPKSNARAAAAASASHGTALAALAALPVKGRAPMTGYSRDRFGDGWLNVDGCDTRDRILRRDLSRKALAGARAKCSADTSTTRTRRGRSRSSAAVARRSTSTTSSPSATHGRRARSSGRRRRRIALANDPLNLLSVDAGANRQKGDGDAATWLPPNKAFRCQYVARQIAVKRRYGAWVTRAERDAMRRVLGKCPGHAAADRGRRARPRDVGAEPLGARIARRRSTPTATPCAPPEWRLFAAAPRHTTPTSGWTATRTASPASSQPVSPLGLGAGRWSYSRKRTTRPPLSVSQRPLSSRPPSGGRSVAQSKRVTAHPPSVEAVVAADAADADVREVAHDQQPCPRAAQPAERADVARLDVAGVDLLAARHRPGRRRRTAPAETTPPARSRGTSHASVIARRCYAQRQHAGAPGAYPRWACGPPRCPCRCAASAIAPRTPCCGRTGASYGRTRAGSSASCARAMPCSSCATPTATAMLGAAGRRDQAGRGPAGRRRARGA